MRVALSRSNTVEVGQVAGTDYRIFVRSVYEFNPDAPADDAFEPGRLAHLVVGNSCRLLDPRRTPFTVVAVKSATGMFIARINDFEDRGATWEMPFEDVGKYQFAHGSKQADAATVQQFEDAVRKFDRPLVIPCEDHVRCETENEIDVARDEALRWIRTKSQFVSAGDALPNPATRRGSNMLCDDLMTYMAEHGLEAMERAVAEQYVRNPNSGEIITGHRIVIAEMGLAPFEGKIVRDPDTFAEDWSREKRRMHIVRRLAFLRALFQMLGLAHVTLFRGLNTTGAIEPPRNFAFTSATFDLAVAQSHFNVGEPDSTRALFRQRVPVERLFMTYLETSAMNEHYLEAEAVLLWDGGNSLF